MPDLSRRTFLGATGSAVLVAGVSPAAGQTADPCQRLQGREFALQDERAFLEDIRTEVEGYENEIADLRSSIEAARDATRGPHPYDEATREQALSVGLDARPGVVFLKIAEGTGEATATGWFVEEDLILTNSHNVSDAGTGEQVVWTVDGTKLDFEIVDRVESQDPDVALLRTRGDTPATLPTASSSALAEGDTVVQVGNPGGFGQWVLTLGEVVGTSGGDLQTTVPGLKGVSGSPLLNMDGVVVGMTYGGTSSEADGGLPPAPGPTTVHQHPFATDSDALHVPIEEAMAKLEEWT